MKKIIKQSDSWLFYKACHDDSYILFHDNRPIVILKDKKGKTIYRLLNNEGKDIVAYHIDNGLIVSNYDNKCDFGVYTEDDQLILVELKGADYLKALRQLTSTIGILFGEWNLKVSRLDARVVLTKARTPQLNTTEEKRLKKTLKRFGNGTLVKQDRLLEETL